MPGREELGCERRIGKPAHIRRRARAIQAIAANEAEVKQQPAEGGDPEAEGVEAGKGHVARADHQRDKVVAKAEENRHAHEEDHGGAVHGEHAIEDLGRDEVIVGHGQLDAHHGGFQPGDEQEDQRVADIQHPDAFVVYRGEPFIHRVEPQLGMSGRGIKGHRAGRLRGHHPVLLLAFNACFSATWPCRP